MAIVTDKIKSVVDFLVKGFEPRETIFDDMAEDDMEGGYEVQDNLAIDPAYSYQSKPEKNQELKVVTHPNYRGYEVRIMEPRSFDDAAQIVKHLKDRKTVLLNLHLLDKEQSVRVVDFLCGATHALCGNQQKIGESVFVFTPHNVNLSSDTIQKPKIISDALWNQPL